jgi:hypothetical protein
MNFEQTQRRHARVETNLLVYFEQRDPAGQMRFNTVGHVLNLSESGLLAEVSCPIEPEMDSEVTLALGADCIELRTRLARFERITSSCYHVALQIDRRSRRVRSRLAQFLCQKASGQAATQAA